ncbi:hypothetical protein ACQEU6_37530 [Spirillospora sp. CA-108201]
MRKITRMALAVTAVTTTATALTTTPAWADGHSVFMPGVPSPSIQPITGGSSGSIEAVTATGGLLSCVNTALSKALTLTGAVRVGTGLPEPSPLGQVTGLTFGNCTMGGLPAWVTPQNLPWTLSLPGFTVSGVTSAQLGGVNLRVDIPGIPCSATFQGSTASNGLINGEHTNPTSAGAASTLTLPRDRLTTNLVATSVSVQCPLSIVRYGDVLAVAGVIELRGVNSTANQGPTVT